MPVTACIIASYQAFIEKSCPTSLSSTANCCCCLSCSATQGIIGILDGWGVIFCCCELYPVVEDTEGARYITANGKCYTNPKEWSQQSCKVTCDYIKNEACPCLGMADLKPVYFDLDGMIREANGAKILGADIVPVQETMERDEANSPAPPVKAGAPEAQTDDI